MQPGGSSLDERIDSLHATHERLLQISGETVKMDLAYIPALAAIFGIGFWSAADGSNRVDK